MHFRLDVSYLYVARENGSYGTWRQSLSSARPNRREPHQESYEPPNELQTACNLTTVNHCRLIDVCSHLPPFVLGSESRFPFSFEPCPSLYPTTTTSEYRSQKHSTSRTCSLGILANFKCESGFRLVYCVEMVPILIPNKVYYHNRKKSTQLCHPPMFIGETASAIRPPRARRALPLAVLLHYVSAPHLRGLETHLPASNFSCSVHPRPPSQTSSTSVGMTHGPHERVGFPRPR